MVRHILTFTFAVLFALSFLPAGALAQQQQRDFEFQEPAEDAGDTAEDAAEDVGEALETVGERAEEIADDPGAEFEGAWEEIQQTLVPPPQVRPTIANNVIVEAGIGTSMFDGELNDAFDSGASWQLRGALNNDALIGFEAAYIGSINQREDTNDIGDAALGTSGQVLLRANWINDSIARPFVVGGVGLTNLTTVGNTELRSPQFEAADDNTAFTVPLGAGVQVYPLENFTVAARVDYTIKTQLIDHNMPSGNLWNVGVNLGAHF
jgi:opacity protein-like surface antigen